MDKLEVNAVTTVFCYENHEASKEAILYVAKDITPEQTALLDRLNSYQYPSALGGDTLLSDNSDETSSPHNPANP
jgi:hypothetical protein